LNARAKTALSALAKKLEIGASVTVTGYAYRDTSLAKLRARVVADYLESKIGIHVTIKIVTTSKVPKVLVTTTRM
jgi:5,10-methylenetetrahydrofolate reductase